MGIGSWFGLGAPEEPPEPAVPAVPTREQLLNAVDRVDAMAREGSVPSVVLARLLRVTGVVRQTVPRLDRLGAGSPQAYNVMATATDYLPEAIGGYLRLPREWADSRPVDRGKTSLMILVDQLDLLGSTMDKVFDAINRADANALVVHGRFLQEKFGQASTGGLLDLAAQAPGAGTVPSATPDSAEAGGSRTGPAEETNQRLQPPDQRLQPPSGWSGS